MRFLFQVNSARICNLKVVLLFLFLIYRHLNAQDFSVLLNLPGDNAHNKVCMLRDSTFVSLSYSFYKSKLTGNNDSLVNIIARHNKSGDMMYFSSFISPVGFLLNPTGMILIKDKIVIGGYLDNSDTIFAFLMRLNNCFDLEKFTVFRHERLNSTPIIYSMQNFSDSELLVNGPYFIEAKDTVYSTLFLMDMDFNIKWHNSNMGYYNDIEVTKKNIHLWGHGNYLKSDSSGDMQLKLHQTILDFNGKTLHEKIRDEHVDDAYSGGGNIVVAKNSAFLISTEFRKTDGTLFNGLDKISINGDILKSVQLNDISKKESASGISRINDNRYIVIGVEEIDNDNSNFMAYIVDSNLTVIRKRSILNTFPEGYIYSLVVGNEILLYGDVLDKKVSNEEKGLFYKIDTFLNVVHKPKQLKYDSLCISPISDNTIKIENIDTVWLDDLNLRRKVNYPSRITSIILNQFLSIFPNPSSGSFIINFDKSKSGSVKVVNLLGESLFYQVFKDKNQILINLDDCIKGLVFIEVKYPDLIVIEKLVIE